MSSPLRPLPVWADVALIPLINVAAAFVISGFVVLAIGENPLEAVQILITGALGDLEGIGFTLYYATSFIFTGLAVAICFHAGLFNIGVEGQAYVAGLGAALVALHMGFLPGYSLVLVAIVGAALFGAAFAFIPGYLQAKRDSHIVITTIMFNYIASALMGYLIVNVMRVPGQMNPENSGVLHLRAGSPVPRAADSARDPLAGHAVQSVVPARACRRFRGLDRDLAHPARLRNPHRRRQCDRRRLRRHFAGAGDDRHHAALGGARGRHGGQRDPRRGAPAHPRIYRRLRLRRHRGRADGARPSRSASSSPRSCSASSIRAGPSSHSRSRRLAAT